jgi:hypothetical protein
MDEHQRRVWGRVADQLDAYDTGELALGQLISNLQGLLGAADIHDQGLIEQFWDHLTPIDGEHELRTEPWAPPGTASDQRLTQALTDFRAWATTLLKDPDTNRR